MFILTEATPNPMTLKFIPGVQVMQSGTAFYTSVESAKESPLALALFEIDGVAAVFLGADFVTVTRNSTQEWETLKPALLTAIMDHFVAGRPVISEGEAKPEGEAGDAPEDAELIKQIKELIDTRVRPAVAMDGGDIQYRGFRDGIVMLELHGSCAGCPSSSATLKHGIENMLKHYVPEVIAVEAIN